MKFLSFLQLALLASTAVLCSCGAQSASEPAIFPENAKPQTTRSHSKKDTVAASTMYANERFRKVRVVKTAINQYRISGEAQVFEAAYSWVVKEGQTELMEGHETTDAGAPAWGAFQFFIVPERRQINQPLSLVLFEYSAKDGSRQYELPIPLS